MSTIRTILLALLVAGCAGTAGPSTPAAPSGTASPTATSTSTPSPSATTRPSPTATGSRPTASATSRPTASPTGLPADLLGRDLTLVPTDRRVVALTFDAGGNADGMAAILATLAAKGVPATFFLTGRWVEAYPTSAADVAAGGYLVGNHTQTHPHFSTLTDAQKTAEVTAGAAAVQAGTGADPRPFFRFPFGERTASDVRLLNAMGYLCVSWTVDTLGWQGTSEGRSADSVLARVLAGLQPGEIVLMHVGSHPKDRSTLDADALPRMVDELRARGYGFVTLAALTG